MDMMLRHVASWVEMNRERFLEWGQQQGDLGGSPGWRLVWSPSHARVAALLNVAWPTRTGEWLAIKSAVFRSDVCSGLDGRPIDALRHLRAHQCIHTEHKGFTCSAAPPGTKRAQVVWLSVGALDVACGNKSVSPSAPAMQEPLQLVQMRDYQRQRHQIFPSLDSLRWFIRSHRAELVDRGALLMPTGTTLICPGPFDAVVVEVGKRRAADAVDD